MGSWWKELQKKPYAAQENFYDAEYAPDGVREKMVLQQKHDLPQRRKQPQEEEGEKEEWLA